MTNQKQGQFLILTLLVASAALPATAQWNKPGILEFDAPGAATVSSAACANAAGCGTVALANNDLGDIVGFYTDANVVSHGFLRTSNGDIISFDAPGAGSSAGLDQGTTAYGINNLGEIAGTAQDSGNVYHGFARDCFGFFTRFQAPGAGTGAFQGTMTFDINLEGATAGVYIDGSNVYHGFARSRQGEITSFDPLGSVYTYTCEETCLNFGA